MTVVHHSYLKLRIIVSQSRQDAMAVRRGGKSNQSDYNFFAALRLGDKKKRLERAKTHRGGQAAFGT
jgi:hypothetical protein